jgi:hypothetical protein
VLLLALVAGWLAALGFILWKLREDALANGLQTAEIHARNFEEHFSQTLQMVDLTASSLKVSDAGQGTRAAARHPAAHAFLAFAVLA